MAMNDAPAGTTALVHACGAEYAADAVFCPGCWQPVAAAPVPVVATSATTVICPHCDRETPPGELCVRCLDPLGAVDVDAVMATGGAAETEDIDEWQRVNLPGPLRDRYTFLRELPSGGQADVLICSDVNDHDRLVVVKIYRPGMSVEDAALDELRAAATDRAHVVPIHDFGRTAGVAWEVQEYVPGGSLAEVFKQHAPFADLGVALRLTRQLWAALTYLHERHLIHRDLKPSNVLVRSEDPLDIALADFGLVALLEATLDVRTVVGTTTYLPPESRGNIVSKSMDWWAMGLILLEALTGRHLFAGADGMLADAVVRNQLYEGTFSIPTTGMARWDALLAGLLAVDYERRWGSVEVGDWLQGRTVLPKQVPAERRGGTVPFVFAGQSFNEPVALAEAMRADGAAALRLLAGPGVEGLRDWLRRTPVGDAAEDILITAAGDPEGALVRLQLLLDPGHPPAYRGRMLTKAGLTSVVRAAVDGDAAAGIWIRHLREHRIFTAWSSADPSLSSAVASADDRLAAHWAAAEAHLSSLPVEIQKVVRGPLEGLILEALAKPQADDLIRRAREAAKGDFSGWAQRLSYAVRSENPSVGEAALAYVALPKAAHAQASRIQIEQVAERSARLVERETVRADRRQAMADELARWAWVWVVVIGWGVHRWSGQTWPGAAVWSVLIGGVAAVVIAARHLVAPAPHATVGWAFFTAAVAGAGQSFADAFHGPGHQVSIAAWAIVSAHVALGSWLARAVNIVVSSRIGDLPVPDVIPAQWLRRPALAAAAVALLADACRRYSEVAAHTHGHIGQTLAQLAAQSDAVRQKATEVADALHPVTLGLPAPLMAVTAAFVATIFLFGSPDLARLAPRLLMAARAAVIVLAIVAAAGSASALVLVTALGGPVVWVALSAAGAALLVTADKAAA